jgi:hypothetical protein
VVSTARSAVCLLTPDRRALGLSPSCLSPRPQGGGRAAQELTKSRAREKYLDLCSAGESTRLGFSSSPPRLAIRSSVVCRRKHRLSPSPPWPARGGSTSQWSLLYLRRPWLPPFFYAPTTGDIYSSKKNPNPQILPPRSEAQLQTTTRGGKLEENLRMYSRGRLLSISSRLFRRR